MKEDISKMETTQKETISKTETTQTAVEWLNAVLISKGILFDYDILEEAKFLEMMQIVKAYHRGLFGGMELDKPIVFADEYYKQTYGSNNQI